MHDEIFEDGVLDDIVLTFPGVIVARAYLANVLAHTVPWPNREFKEELPYIFKGSHIKAYKI